MRRIFMGRPARRRPAHTPFRIAGTVGTVVVLAALAACSAPASEPAAGVLVTTSGASAFKGTAVEPPFTLPTQEFTDTEGRTVTLADVADGPTVMIFAYTNCPDVCNAQLAALAAALRRSTDAVKDQVRVVMISTDPARDDAEAMRTYLDGFGQGYVGLRADLPTTLAAAKTLGVSIERGDATGNGGYEVDHTAALFGFDAQQQGVVLWQPGVAVADLVTDLETMVP
jgi:protein SCO1/2